MLDQCDQAERTHSYFGGCPECKGGSGLMRTTDTGHWLSCDEHRTKWNVGANLFSGPESVTFEEIKASRQADADFLADYEAVEPYEARDDTLSERAKREARPY